MSEKIMEKKEFNELIEEYEPKSKLFTNCLKAFVVGGLICDLGQLITNISLNFNFTKDEAAIITTITLIFLSALFTGLGLYGKLGKFAGAGSAVPITGFANSVVSPAIEFKKEGYIFGLAAKMFIIAGPVLVYGTAMSVIIGLIHYFIK